MALDYKALAAEKKQAILKDLQEVVAIDSSRDVAHKTAELPVGPGPAKALAKFLEFAERDGFQTENVDQVAGRIEFGNGNQETLGIIGHADVVPAGEGWTTDPFTVVQKDGKLYGRGTADDKGPTLAAYYALKILKEQGVEVHKNIHFIIGTDEENDWIGINRYLETEPKPDLVFSPDAEFPIINGEKGIVSFTLTFKNPVVKDSPYHLIEFTSGLADNMVPQTATASITTSSNDDLSASFNAFLQDHHLTGEIEKTADGYKINLVGQGAHGSEPELGRNAATFLALFLDQFEFAGRDKDYLDFIANTLHEDFTGKNLGIAHTDALMGELSAAPDIYVYNETTATVVVNVRYPDGTNPEKMVKQMTDHFGEILSATSARAEEPHYVSGDDELVKTLLAVYERQTGHKGHEQIIGGGTYGRIFDRGVAFGAQPEGQPNVMHQPNEYMDEQALIDAIAIYTEAIYQLTR